MSREIKFRIFATGKKMVYTTSEIWRCGEYASLCFAVDTENEDLLWKIEPDQSFITMQFTGLKDRNGKEIYEGDIVRTDTGHVQEIYFADGMFRCKESTSETDWAIDSTDEVIGNIYENKELFPA